MSRKEIKLWFEFLTITIVVSEKMFAGSKCILKKNYLALLVYHFAQ